VGACHHGMARPQVADGGTTSNMIWYTRWAKSRYTLYSI